MKTIAAPKQVILCGDSDVYANRALRSALRSTERRIITTSSAWKFIRLALEVEPEVVFVGQDMKELDGLTTLQIILKLQKNRPEVILMTANDSRSRLRGYLNGADVVLEKPVDADTALAAVQYVLSGYDRVCDPVVLNHLIYRRYEAQATLVLPGGDYEL